MELIKREHQYSQEKRAYEVLDRRELIEIAENIDTTEVQKELIGMAYDNYFMGDYRARAIAELSARTGDIVYSVEVAGTTSLEPKLYVLIGSASASPDTFEYENENVLDSNYVDEYNSLIEDEDSGFYGNETLAFLHILEKYNLDGDKLVRDYFVEYYSECVEIAETSEIIKDIKEMYNEESIFVDNEIDKEELLSELNTEEYECYRDCSTKEELIQEVISHIEETYENFGFGIDESDYDDEDIYNEAVCNNQKKYIEDRLRWSGKGSYAIRMSYDLNNFEINKIDNFLNDELEELNFVTNLNIKAVNNPVAFMQNWKDEEGYNYIYLISHIVHIKIPYEYSISAVVYSNKKIDNVIEYLKENEAIEIGEFGILGANHRVDECEDFDMSKIAQYKLNDYDESYESIYIED